MPEALGSSAPVVEPQPEPLRDPLAATAQRATPMPASPEAETEPVDPPRPDHQSVAPELRGTGTNGCGPTPDCRPEAVPNNAVLDPTGKMLVSALVAAQVPAFTRPHRRATESVALGTSGCHRYLGFLPGRFSLVKTVF